MGIIGKKSPVTILTRVLGTSCALQQRAEHSTSQRLHQAKANACIVSGYSLTQQRHPAKTKLGTGSGKIPVQI